MNWTREVAIVRLKAPDLDVIAQAWLGEIGPAPHRHFAGHDKLASWVSLCPGNNISARKRKHGRTGDAGTYIKPMLVQAVAGGFDGEMVHAVLFQLRQQCVNLHRIGRGVRQRQGPLGPDHTDRAARHGVYVADAQGNVFFTDQPWSMSPAAR